jgi:hypothetical protein
MKKSRVREVFDLSMAYELYSGRSEDILEAVLPHSLIQLPGAITTMCGILV